MMRLFWLFALFLGATSAQNQTQDACTNWKTKVGKLEITKVKSGAYHFKDYYLSWQKAQEFCKSHGMSLAVFETEEEMLAIKAARPKDYEPYWVGAHDIGREPADFHWTDGRKVERAWWRDQEESGPGKQTCIYLSRGLDDDACTSIWNSVCEVAPEHVSCV